MSYLGGINTISLQHARQDLRILICIYALDSQLTMHAEIEVNLCLSSTMFRKSYLERIYFEDENIANFIETRENMTSCRTFLSICYEFYVHYLCNF